MKHRNIKRIFICSYLIIQGLSFIALINASSYKGLGIEAGDAVVWEFDNVNLNRIQRLIDNEGYDDSYTEIYDGYQIKWNIKGVELINDGTTEYYRYDYEHFEGTNLDTTQGESYGDDYWYVGTDPVFVGKDWFDNETSYYFNIRIIPKEDVENYLKEFVDNIISSKKLMYSASGKVLTIDYTKLGYHDKATLEYNTLGILSKYSVYYDNELAYELVYQGIYEQVQAELDFMVIIVIISIAGMCGIMGICMFRKKRYQQQKFKPIYSYQREQVKPVEPIPYLQPEPLQISQPTPVIERPKDDDFEFRGFCSVCGAKRDSDAEFCFECGNRF